MTEVLNNTVSEYNKYQRSISTDLHLKSCSFFSLFLGKGPVMGWIVSPQVNSWTPYTTDHNYRFGDRMLEIQIKFILAIKGNYEGRGLINQELRINIHTILYKRQATSKNLLCSTRNSAQYSVRIYMRKESEKEWMYIYMYNWVTLGYTWNTTCNKKKRQLNLKKRKRSLQLALTQSD